MASGFFTTEMPGKPGVNFGAWNILSREKKSAPLMIPNRDERKSMNLDILWEKPEVPAVGFTVLPVSSCLE